MLKVYIEFLVLKPTCRNDMLPKLVTAKLQNECEKCYWHHSKILESIPKMRRQHYIKPGKN